jgi:hypothetical protein
MNKMQSHGLRGLRWRGRPLPLAEKLALHASQAGLVRLTEGAVACASASPAALRALRAPTRGALGESALRQTAMYLAHVGLGVSLTATGLGLGRDRTTVRHACSLVEERRTSPAQDQALAALEWGLRAQARSLLGWALNGMEAAHD